MSGALLSKEKVLEDTVTSQDLHVGSAALSSLLDSSIRDAHPLTVLLKTQAVTLQGYYFF